MSCGAPASLKKLVNNFKNLETTLGPAFKTLNADPSGLAWKAVSNALGGGTLAPLKGNIAAAIKSHIPDIGIDLDSLSVPGIQKDFTDLAKNITSAAITGQDLLNRIDLLKQKYAGYDIKNLDFNNVENLIEQLKRDGDNLCKLLPNLQEGPAGFVLKGLPVTFPEKNPEGTSAAAVITEVTIPQIQIDVARRVQEANARYVDITAPSLYNNTDPDAITTNTTTELQETVTAQTAAANANLPNILGD